MSVLVVETLGSIPLEQEFRLALESRYNIGAFIPYLFMFNAPVGTFTFSIIDSDSNTVFTQDFTSTDIKQALNTSDNYAHSFHPIIPENPCLLERGLYTARLSASGYTTVGGHLGWIRQHEDLNNVLDYTPLTDADNPLALRLKIYEQGIQA